MEFRWKLGFFGGIKNFLLRGIPHSGDMETLKQGEMKTRRNNDMGTGTSRCWNMGPHGDIKTWN
jgi:hypothetical protein